MTEENYPIQKLSEKIPSAKMWMYSEAIAGIIGAGSLFYIINSAGNVPKPMIENYSKQNTPEWKEYKSESNKHGFMLLAGYLLAFAGGVLFNTPRTEQKRLKTESRLLEGMAKEISDYTEINREERQRERSDYIESLKDKS